MLTASLGLTIAPPPFQPFSSILTSQCDKREVEAITNIDNELWLSVASIWEIGIKVKIGKFKLPQSPEIFIPQQMQVDGLQSCLITPDHALKAADLPLHHKDPFDRMLITQTQDSSFILLTNDSAFARYEVTTLC